MNLSQPSSSIRGLITSDAVRAIVNVKMSKSILWGFRWYSASNAASRALQASTNLLRRSSSSWILRLPDVAGAIRRVRLPDAAVGGQLGHLGPRAPLGRRRSHRKTATGGMAGVQPSARARAEALRRTRGALRTRHCRAPALPPGATWRPEAPSRLKLPAVGGDRTSRGAAIFSIWTSLTFPRRALQDGFLSAFPRAHPGCFTLSFVSGDCNAPHAERPAGPGACSVLQPTLG